MYEALIKPEARASARARERERERQREREKGNLHSRIKSCGSSKEIARFAVFVRSASTYHYTALLTSFA